jgi:ribosomal protein L11 methyltransferase
VHDDGWFRVTVTVPLEQAELAADLLWGHGTAGVEERPDGAAVALLGGFADGADATAAHRALQGAGLVAELQRLDEAAIASDLDAWRAHATPVEAGGIWLVPPWLAPPDGVDPTDVLVLDPGRAFGSGSHPTTRLVLDLLAARASTAGRVLDVGCGSGVLAVAAARWGAAEVVAIDIDPAAVAATAENAERNGVHDRVRASARPLASVLADEAPFDLVVANLLAPIVRELAPDLIAATAPHGQLIASGLLADRWAEATAALAPLEVAEVAEDDGWVAVVLAHEVAAAHR